MKDKANFAITGSLTRKFVAPSGKFCRFSVETFTDGRKTINTVLSFDHGVCRMLSGIGIGESLNVAGELGASLLSDKDKEPIMVNGYKYYETILKATAVAAIATKETPQAKVDTMDDGGAPDSDPIPF